MGGRHHELTQLMRLRGGKNGLHAAVVAAPFSFVDFAITMAYNPQVTRAAYRWLGMVMTFQQVTENTVLTA